MKRKQLSGIWREGEWLLLAALAIVAAGLGYAGFARHSAAVGAGRTPSDIVYLVLQLFMLESGAVPGPVPWELQAARVLAPFVGLYAATKAVFTLFAEQFQHTRLWRLRDHAVVCGGGRKGLALARAFRERGVGVVVIEADPDSRSAVAARAAGAAVLIGDAADAATLHRARLSRARCALVVCGSDGTNAEVAVTVKEAAAEMREHPLTCAVHITDPELCYLLRDRWSAAWTEASVRIEFFNVFDRGARAVLDAFPPAAAWETGQRHLLVVGLGLFGESLVLQAAWRWRAVGPGMGRRQPLLISVVDVEADRKCAMLCARIADLPEVCSVRPLTMDVTSPEFERGEFLEGLAGSPAVTCAYVCLDDDTRALSAALVLRRRLRHAHVPIVVRMERDAGLAALVGRAAADSRQLDINLFGLLDRACTPEYALHGTLEALARALHENYVRHQTAKGDTHADNPSLASWEVLPENVKAANRRQAVGLRAVLAVGGYDVEARRSWDAAPLGLSGEEVERLAHAEHERWVSERRSARWRFAPGPKDARRRTSPHLVPWEELSEAVREIDREIIRDLPVLLADAGYAIQRVEQPGNR